MGAFGRSRSYRSVEGRDKMPAKMDEVDGHWRGERYAAWLLAGLHVDALLYLAGDHYIFLQARWIFANLVAIPSSLAQGAFLIPRGLSGGYGSQYLGDCAA